MKEDHSEKFMLAGNSFMLVNCFE